MARLKHSGSAVWYEVARRWVDAALVNGDSMFTPGIPIWTIENIDELYRRFVENADEGEGDFLAKLDGQLAGAQSSVRQLMAELLYAYYLPTNEFPKPETKRGVVRRVLEGTSPPVSLPEDLSAALERGIAKPGQAYVQQRYYQLDFYLDAVRRWWRATAEDRKLMLADPWALKAFVADIDLFANDAARHLFLYLVHPDSFESIMAGKHRAAIAETFAEGEERSIADEDQRLLAIRSRMSRERGEHWSYYAGDLEAKWRPEPMDDDSDKEVGSRKRKPRADSHKAIFNEYLARNPHASFDEVKQYMASRGSAPSDNTIYTFLYHAGPALRAYIDLHRDDGSKGRPDSDHTVPQIGGGSPPAGPIADLLLKRKNVVLHGPPGTGKTRATLQLVDAWIGWQGDGSVEQVTFHPSYAYEDFIEGFRPDASGKFTLRPGLFVEFCRRAAAEPARQFLLVIDELNRGDVARIFGELITLIERDKRGLAFARLPYSHERFTVPANLYLLGTMNAADRSVSLLDVAIRRRFSFASMQPSARAITDSHEHHRVVGDLDLALLMGAINRRLLAANVDRDRAIGHSHFLIKLGDDAIAELRERFRHDVVPLVHEYCYANVGQMRGVLCGLVRDGEIDDAVFADDQRFAAALIAICAKDGAS